MTSCLKYSKYKQQFILYTFNILISIFIDVKAMTKMMRAIKTIMFPDARIDDFFTVMPKKVNSLKCRLHSTNKVLKMIVGRYETPIQKYWMELVKGVFIQKRNGFNK